MKFLDKLKIPRLMCCIQSVMLDVLEGAGSSTIEHDGKLITCSRDGQGVVFIEIKDRVLRT